MDEQIESLPWLAEVMSTVRALLQQQNEERVQVRPAFQHEYAELEANVRGWRQSLGNPKLPDKVRTLIESDMAAAVERMDAIEQALAVQQQDEAQVDDLFDPHAVLARLQRLPEVLAQNNPTLGNLELSLHIDRIVCLPDGTVRLRTCKLAGGTEVVEQLSSLHGENLCTGTGHIRRRARLRTDDSEHDAEELRMLAEFAADPERFAGLGDEFFWLDEFKIPPPPLSWAEEHAERVFQRRQQTGDSYAKLGTFFQVTAPTARAAVRCFLARHPDAVDAVQPQRGGKRGKRIDVSPFAAEVRRLRENEWSKLRIANHLGLATSVVDRALKHAYAETGEPVSTVEEIRAGRIRRARQLHESGISLEDIAQQLGCSNVTARKYLKRSFELDGQAMPDLRERDAKAKRHKRSA